MYFKLFIANVIIWFTDNSSIKYIFDFLHKRNFEILNQIFSLDSNEIFYAKM